MKCENEINNFVGGTADLKLGIEGENSPEYGNYDDDDDNLFCNQIFNSTEFVLQSPNYPRPYPNDIDCNILVLGAERVLYANVSKLEVKTSNVSILRIHIEAQISFYEQTKIKSRNS